MATIDDAYLKAEQTNSAVLNLQTKVDSLTLYVEAYRSMTSPSPLTITLGDGITTIDNLKKSSDKVRTQVDNFLNPDSTVKVSYVDGNGNVVEGDNLAYIAQLAGVNVHAHANKAFLDTITSFKTIKGISILGSGDITFNEFSGNYNDLSNKPTFATINGQAITNGGNFTLLTQVYDYVSTTIPTITTNPSTDNAISLDSTTGEIFVCVDRTANANVWKGTNGTIVNGFNDLDPFGDGSQIAFYKFNGDATTEINSPTYDGTATNVTYSINGVELNDSQVKIVDTGLTFPITVTCWVKHSSSQTSSGYVRHAVNFSQAGSDSIAIAFYSGTWQGMTSATTLNSGNATEDNFIFIAFVIEASQMSISINGGTFTSSSISGVSLDDWTFGSDYSGNANQDFTGAIKNIRILNRSLSLLEVQEIYNQENS